MYYRKVPPVTWQPRTRENLPEFIVDAHTYRRRLVELRGVYLDAAVVYGIWTAILVFGSFENARGWRLLVYLVGVVYTVTKCHTAATRSRHYRREIAAMSDHMDRP
jgi:hypothetical protein